ncbi:hypothetical protein GCM10008906_13610 [Clostridium oceanicum]|uniref:Uncharacterized protein n=1 Tax=Clostridium oceanicum TaxID=1543 RepID=A0ABP3UQK1_9CLOT
MKKNICLYIIYAFLITVTIMTIYVVQKDINVIFINKFLAIYIGFTFIFLIYILIIAFLKTKKL